MSNIELMNVPAKRSRTAVAMGLAAAVLMSGCSTTDTYKIAGRDRIEPCVSDNEDPYSLYGMRAGAEQEVQIEEYDKLRAKVSSQLSDIYRRTRTNKGRIDIDFLMGSNYELENEASARITKVGRLELKASDLLDYADDQTISVGIGENKQPVVPVGAVVCDLMGSAVETRFVSMVDAFHDATQAYSVE